MRWYHYGLKLEIRIELASPMRIAVIDLGTNTCNLLVAELVNGSYTILHQSKQMVKLGDGKIKENEISTEATERTINSFRLHKEIVENLDTQSIKAIATSAVRTAENKIEFLEAIGNDSGWLVKLVSGEKEAELIFKGVLLAFETISKPSVILDIGGGSNELILAHKKEVLWKESRPTGMSRVINNFSLFDPIDSEQISVLQDYFAKEHQLAIQNCREKKVETLIGCSGAFDTIADMVDEVNPGEKQRVKQAISLSDFNKVYEKLLASTREERLVMKGVDHVRVDLIVPAVILIEKLISEIGILQIVQTDFALREGVLYEKLHPGN